jgi:chromosome segregation ATPase
MTGDELERAIDFILKSQARAETRIERNEEQLSRNEEQLSRLAEQVSHLTQHGAELTQQGADFQKRLDFIATVHASLEDSHADLVRVMKQHLETEDRINKSLRVADVRQARLIASLGETLRASEESSRASDESLRAAMAELAARQSQTEATVDRLSQKVEALAEQTGGTDRRLEALIKIVEGQRGGR